MYYSNLIPSKCSVRCISQWQPVHHGSLWQKLRLCCECQLWSHAIFAICLMSSRKSRKKTAHNPETQITAAIAFLCKKSLDIRVKTPSYAYIAVQVGVDKTTFRHQYFGLCQSPRTAHEKQKILTAAHEEVLIQWMIHHAEEGRPWGHEKIHAKVCKMTGRWLSLDWVTAFKLQHEKVLKFCGTSGLDPKQAQAFNSNCIGDHFQKLGAAREEYQYKVWNIYNFDETGMQIGGGRKRTGKRFFIARCSWARYKQRDASLELVTVVKCACADGSLLDPGFIFQGGHTYDLDWFLEEFPDIS